MKRLNIPYGESDFVKIRHKKMEFIDKTRFLTILEEQPSFQFFIRPRRFGKSLWINLMEQYYDFNNREKFEELFGNLYT